MITIDGMAKKHGGVGTPGHWKGEAVDERPAEQAERGADRAEGNAPIRADVEDERLRHADPRGQPQESRPRAPHADDPEEDTADAAEAHQARDEREQPPRGKL